MPATRHLASLAIIASVLLVVVAARSSRRALMRTTPAVVDLRAIYANIRRQADESAPVHWPNAEKIVAKCLRSAGGKVLPPAFDDGNGPIGAYAMLTTENNLEVLRWCGAAFERFLADVEGTLTTESQRHEHANLLYIVAERSWHSCVTVFHEHPSLLPEVDRLKWQSVDAATAAQLAQAVRQSTSSLAAPQLTLDSLSICADGAMIAGFVDDATGSFSALRQASADAALATLGGELTSRPKALIHVTLGRVLGAPSSQTADQRQRVAELVRHYNQEAFPALIDSASPKTLKVSTLSLARDSVWWMTQYELHDTWSLS